MSDYVGDEQELVDRQMDAQRTQLSQPAEVYYFCTAFDKHASGMSQGEAEKAAQNVCYQVWGVNNIAFPVVPWNRYKIISTRNGEQNGN